MPVCLASECRQIGCNINATKSAMNESRSHSTLRAITSAILHVVAGPDLAGGSPEAQLRWETVKAL